MSYFVYAVRSESTGKIYIGQTNNLLERIKRHNGELFSKDGSYTKVNKGPWTLFYKEEVMSRAAALIRERQLKSQKGREFIRSIVLGGRSLNGQSTCL